MIQSDAPSVISMSLRSSTTKDHNNKDNASVFSDFSKYAYSLPAPESVGGRLVVPRAVVATSTTPDNPNPDEDTVDDFSKYAYSLQAPEESVGGRLVGNANFNLNPVYKLPASIHVRPQDSVMNLNLNPEDLTELSYDVIVTNPSSAHLIKSTTTAASTSMSVASCASTKSKMRVGSLAVGIIEEDKIELSAPLENSEEEQEEEEEEQDNLLPEIPLETPIPATTRTTQPVPHHVQSTKKQTPAKPSLWKSLQKWTSMLLCNSNKKNSTKMQDNSAWC